MSRPDFENEVIRKANLVAKAQPRTALLVGLAEDAAQSLTRLWPSSLAKVVSSGDQAVVSLRGIVRPPVHKLAWAETNLGIGLSLAREQRMALVVDASVPPSPITLVKAGLHLLIACEAGDEFSQVVSSNFAFATGASFLVFDMLAEEVKEDWLESLYLVGSHEERSSFADIVAKARDWLPDELKSGRYREIVFVTHGFPWGIALPERPTSHLYANADIDRTVVDGIWASMNLSRDARNAVLVQPQKVQGSEVAVIADALVKNKTLCRIMEGPSATVVAVDTMLQSLPLDVLVFATHAGEWHGERLTYEYTESSGRERVLTVDEALGFGYDPTTDLYMVQSFNHFHELDGVRWNDAEGKRRISAGEAITAWEAIPFETRRQKIVHSERIDRVKGAMALQMFDNVWLPAIHGFPGPCSPFILNNACSSFHELSGRFIFAGARAYVGTLFPVAEIEAEEIAKHIFGTQLGQNLSYALWKAQNEVYGQQTRRPYVLVGLPFCSVQRNVVDSVHYLLSEIRRGIEQYKEKVEGHLDEGVRRNSARMIDALMEEAAKLGSTLRRHVDYPP
jgi:hypothetical protein